MQLLKPGIVIAAAVGFVISLAVFLLTFTNAAFITGSPATLPSASVPPSWRALDALPFPFLLGLGLLGVLSVLTTFVMPAPWYRPLFFGAYRRRINWVLTGAGTLSMLIFAGLIVSSAAGLVTGEHPARHGEGYAVYNQGSLVREIDKAEFDRLQADSEQQFHRNLWRAMSSLQLINYLGIAGYGLWYLRTGQQPDSGPVIGMTRDPQFWQ